MRNKTGADQLQKNNFMYFSFMQMLKSKIAISFDFHTK